MPLSPLFSIVTPSYNSLAGLQNTIASVLAQPKGLYEYRIVDGSSTDGTLAWLQEQRDDRLQWISEADTGVYDAMNKGLSAATGRFLYFLGAGDELLPGVLERVADYIPKLPSGKSRLIYGDVQTGPKYGHMRSGYFSKYDLCQKNICHQAIFYERELFDFFGPYELEYPVFADWALNLSCFGDPRVQTCYWPHVVAKFEGGGLSDTTPDVQFCRNRVQLIRNRVGWLPAFRLWASEKLRSRLDRLTNFRRRRFH